MWHKQHAKAEQIGQWQSIHPFVNLSIHYQYHLPIRITGKLEILQADLDYTATRQLGNRFANDWG